jgi:hypothetical protein
MKVVLAIALTSVLAAVSLTFGAPVTPISGTAVAGGNVGPQYWCGAPICPTPNPPWTTRGR